MAPLIAFLVSLGVVCGHALGIIAKSELKYGKKFLNFLQVALFLSANLLIMHFMRDSSIVVAIGGAGIFFFTYYFEKVKQWMVYGYLGLLHGLALTTANYYPVAGLLFLYGLPSGSFIKKKEVLAYCIIAFVLLSFFTEAFIAKALNI